MRITMISIIVLDKYYHVSGSSDIAGWVHRFGNVGTDVKLDEEIGRVCIVRCWDDVVCSTVGCYIDEISSTPAPNIIVLREAKQVRIHLWNAYSGTLLILRTSKFRTPAGHCLLYYRIRGTSLVRTLCAVLRVPVIERFHALYVMHLSDKAVTYNTFASFHPLKCYPPVGRH